MTKSKPAIFKAIVPFQSFITSLNVIDLQLASFPLLSISLYKELYQSMWLFSQPNHIPKWGNSISSFKSPSIGVHTAFLCRLQNRIPFHTAEPVWLKGSLPCFLLHSVLRSNPFVDNTTMEMKLLFLMNPSGL